MATKPSDKFDPSTARLEEPSTAFDPTTAKLEPEGPARTIGGTIKDIGVTALKGAVAVPQSAVGLASLATGGLVGKGLESVGLRFNDAQKILDDQYSDAQKAAQQKVQQAEGFTGTAAAMLQNPSTIATAAGASIPSMFAGGAAARGLGLVGKFGPAVGAAMGDGIMGSGSAAEQIRGETADGLLTAQQAGLAGLTGVVTAALGAAGGRVAQRLGIGDVDTMIAKGSLGTAGETASKAGMAGQMARGALAEGVLEELPQSVNEQILQNLALDKDWSEGVDKAAAQGLIVGAAMGVGGGGLGAVGNRRAAAAEAEQVAEQQRAAGAAEQATTSAQGLTDQMDANQRAALSKAAATSAQANLDAVASEEVPETLPEQTAAPDGRALLDAQQAANRAEQSPDDEIYQSTGASAAQSFAPEPMPDPVVLADGSMALTGSDVAQARSMGLKPSQALGIDESAGPLSAAAAQAIDSGATTQLAVKSGNAPAVSEQSTTNSIANNAQQQSAGTGFQGQVPATAARNQAPVATGVDAVAAAPVPAAGTGAGAVQAAGLSVAENATVVAPQETPGPALRLQNRDRSSAASVAQMNSIAAAPDYLRTGPSRTMDQGAPVVFGDTPASAVMGRAETVADGRGDRVQARYAVVEAGDVLTSHQADGTPIAGYEAGEPGKVRAVAGNGRAAGLTEGYRRGTAGTYRAELEQDAQSVGIDPAAVRAMRSPVLVRVMDQADVTPDIGDRSNTVGTQRLSPVEQAANDAARVDLGALQFTDDGRPQPASINGFVQAMPESERGDMLNPDGTATRQAVDRLMSAVFKQAYDNDALVQLYAQATDPEARAVMSALADAAGAMAGLSGQGDFDIRSAVADAAGMAVNATRQGLKLADVLQNADLDMNPEAFVVAEFMAQNIRSSKRMADGLRNMAQLALEQVQIARDNETQAGMFGETPTVPRQQILESLNRDIQTQSTADAGRPGTAARGAERQGADAHADAGGQADRAERGGQREAGQAEDRLSERPANWRTNYLRAAGVARGLGIDPKQHKTTAALVAAIEAADFAQNQAPAQASQAQAATETVADSGEFALTSPTPDDIIASQEALEREQADRAAADAQAERRARADAERDSFTLTGSDRAADVAEARGQAPMFSRSATTRQKYEARIDALMAGGKATVGTRVLDRSDVMGLLGHPNVPMMLNERHLIDGLTTHPEMTAAAWKKVPDWLENPAMVYRDPRDTGRLVAIAPDTLAGYPVMLIVEPKPNPAGSKPAPAVPTESLLVTVYAKTSGNLPAPGFLASGGNLLYVDTKNAPEIARRGGVQFPKQAALLQGRSKILTEKNLAGWRKANAPTSPDTDVRYSFAGQGAITADRHALAAAEQRIAAGEDAEAVRQDTGWSKGVDGRWKFEINDADAALVLAPEEFRAFADAGGSVNLGDVLDHPALFAAYPQLANLPVGAKAGRGASYSTAKGQILMGRDVPAGQFRSVLMHEVQHGIQTIEGFATGGAVAQYRGDHQAQRDQYRREAGEVEARNVQARLDMTDAERQAFAPDMTADVEPGAQVVSFNGKVAANAPAPANGQAMPAYAERLVAGVQSSVDKIKAKWKNAPEVVVLHSMQDEKVPERVRAADAAQRSQGAEGEPEGFFFQGKVYVVASQMHSRADVARVLMHETLGHFGLRGVFGKTLDAQLRQLMLGRQKDVIARARNYGLVGEGVNVDTATDVEVWASMSERQRMEAAEEVLAFLAQTEPQLSVVQRAIAAIRTWLRENVPALAGIEMTDAEVINKYILPARNWVERGEGQASGGRAAFSRANDQTKTEAFKKWFNGSAVVDENGEPLVGRELAVAMYERGASSATVAKAMGDVSVATVKRWVSDAGAQRTASEARGGTKENRAEAVRLYGEGLGAFAIAERLGVSNGGVYNWLRDAGVEIRSLSEAQALRAAQGRQPIRGVRSTVATKWGEIRTDSVYEAARLRQLETDQEVESVARAIESIKWGENQRYTPDFVVTMKDGSVRVEEVKPTFQQDRDDVVAKAEAARESLGSDADYKMVVTEDLASGFVALRDMAGLSFASDADRGRFKRALATAKSATGNSGAFDPNDDRIQFSRAAPTQTGWNSPEASRFDDKVYLLQDKHIDTKRVIEALDESGRQVSEDLNVYLQEELFHGRVAKRVGDFQTGEMASVMEAIKRAGMDIGDVEEYLHARHAKEANALIAQREPSMADGGSGMTNAAADAYMAALPAADRQKLEGIAAMVDGVIANTRQLYADYGLESKDTVDGWGTMFKHYVPLQREDKEGGMGIGQGFSVKGKEVKGRTGSTRKVVDILANIALQREKVLVRGEKNRVAAALVGLVQANPNDKFWRVGPPEATRVYDPKTDSVVDRVDPNYKTRENVVVAKIPQADGSVQEMAVTFNESDPRALRMAGALKNLDAARIEGLLGVSAKITRYFAAVNTQWNPVFGAVNLVRDVQGAMVNLQSTPLAGLQGKIAKDTAAALAGIYSELRRVRKGGKAGSKWAQLFDQFQEDGGQTGYRDQFANSADRAEALKRQLNPAAWAETKAGRIITAGGTLTVPMEQARKVLGPVFNWLTDYNDAMENGVRLAAYKAALDKGLSRQQAASIAKNLTVNFNRKGQVAQQAGALYAFFNAAMQGTARIAEALFTMDKGDIKSLRLSKTGKQVVYGGMLLGTLQAMALAGAGFDDEDPPDFARERNLIIPTGGKSYVSIPMPLGLHVIPGIGRHAMEFALGGFKDPAKRAISVAGMFADAFNPIGNAGMSMQTLAPTVLDPLVALTENKDYTGKPIARVSSNKDMPGHLQGKDTSTYIGKLLSESINFASGGNHYRAGVFSPTPDQIDYLFAQVTGGVGREYAKVEQTATSLAQGEELPPYKVPFFGRFYGNAKSQASQGTAFYAATGRLNALETEAKNMRKDGNWQGALQLIQSRPDARLIDQANETERRVQELRREKRALVAKGASRDVVRAKEEQITQVMQRFNESFAKVQAS